MLDRSVPEGLESSVQLPSGLGQAGYRHERHVGGPEIASADYASTCEASPPGIIVLPGPIVVTDSYVAEFGYSLLRDISR